MSTDDDRQLRSWLAARDPGQAPARLWAAASRVPYETRQPALPAVDAAIARVFGRSQWVRPMLIVAVMLAIVLAVVGAALVQPWRPFPPHGLIAFTTRLDAIGSSGIRLIAADGSAERRITPLVDNLFDHSPRWSPDGRTLLFARTSGLDGVNFCGGFGSIVQYDVATATERVVAAGLPPLNVVAWSPSGDRAAYLFPPPGCDPGTAELGVVDVATGKVTTSALGGGPWQLQWSGESVSAIPGKRLLEKGPGDFKTTLEVPSHAGTALARFEFQPFPFQPRPGAHLEVTSGPATAPVDLGAGAVPAWAPDDSAIAFIEPGGPPSTIAGELLRHGLAIAHAGAWQPKIVADVFWPGELPPDSLPQVFWTADGGAIYWMDGRGGHVVDVVTGRMTDLPDVLDGCPDLQWQPVP